MTFAELEWEKPLGTALSFPLPVRLRQSFFMSFHQPRQSTTTCTLFHHKQEYTENDIHTVDIDNSTSTSTAKIKTTYSYRHRFLPHSFTLIDLIQLLLLKSKPSLKPSTSTYLLRLLLLLLRIPFLPPNLDVDVLDQECLLLNYLMLPRRKLHLDRKSSR